ncbi:MAG: DUF1579 domain-containing protein [Chitinophagales bacterium]|nr:DUF1579 domain-containing protein [Chitinophagales bacterium]
MKHSFFLSLIALLIITACNQPQPAPAEEAPQKKEDTTAVPASVTPPDSAATMEAWTAYATPGPMHAMLASFDGEWTGDLTMWMEPGKPPMKTTGIAVNSMILGGRYQYSKHSMLFNGMPFEGISTLGYDNVKKKFISSWVDNMGSGIMLLEGTWDEANKTINSSGKQVDPMTGQDMDVREVVKIIDDNTQLMQMFMKYPGGEEFQTMEIKSTRKAS